MVTLHKRHRACGLQLAHSLSLPAVPDLQLVSSTDEGVELFVEVHGVDVGISVEGGEELAFLEAESVDLVD